MKFVDNAGNLKGIWHQDKRFFVVSIPTVTIGKTMFCSLESVSLDSNNLIIKDATYNIGKLSKLNKFKKYKIDLIYDIVDCEANKVGCKKIKIKARLRDFILDFDASNGLSPEFIFKVIGIKEIEEIPQL